MTACESVHSEPTNSCESALAERDIMSNSSVSSVITCSGSEDGGMSVSMDGGSEPPSLDSPSVDDLQILPVVEPTHVSKIAEQQR